MLKCNATLCALIICILIISFILSRLTNTDSSLTETSVRFFDHNTTLSSISTKSSYDCTWSLLESDDFFCESDDDWYRRKNLFHIQHQRNHYSNSMDMLLPDNYESTFSCRFEQRLDFNGNGGKWICDVYRIAQLSSCLIYSLGSNGEFSFESETKQFLPNCDIHTFDMNVFVCPANVCTIHKKHLGNGKKGTKSLSMIMTELNHTGRHIDILKVDTESGEFDFFDNLFNTNDHLNQRIRQILFKIHLPKINQNKTSVIDYASIHKLFDSFHKNHFVIFHKEVNLYDTYIAFEYGMVRLNERFFQTTSNNIITKLSP